VGHVFMVVVEIMGTWLSVEGRVLMTQILFMCMSLLNASEKKLVPPNFYLFLRRNPMWIGIKDVVSTLEKGPLDYP
jgi:hypothetical protein